MTMTFITSHTTPLYSTQWTPRSRAGYAGTCIFLIVLAVMFRLLLASKHRLERAWLDRDLNRRYVVAAGRRREKDIVTDDGDARSAMLVSAAGVEEEVRVVRRHVRGPIPWRISVDLPRAAIVTVLAGVGYLLYVFFTLSSILFLHPLGVWCDDDLNGGNWIMGNGC